MATRIRAHLTYANVVATFCLFVVLGGTSYAALKVTGKSVKNGSLTGVDVKNESIRSADVSGLRAKDFRPGELKTSQVNGLPGPPGPKGDSGATNVTVVRSDVTVSASSQNSTWALCPPGQRATGGGVGSTGTGTNDRIMQSGPIDGDLNFSAMSTGKVPTGWYGRYFYSGSPSTTAYVYVICSAP
jgi:hypothetical protein